MKNLTNNLKDYVIMILLVISVTANMFMVYSVQTMHSFTMQFVTDTFYSSAPILEEDTIPHTIDDGHNHTQEELDLLNPIKE